MIRFRLSLIISYNKFHLINMNTHLSNLDSNRIEYYTPKWVWECLKPHIPKDKVIWECFRNEDKASCYSAEHLRELGFEVVNPYCDFFENNYGDIVVSNPPFNRKKEVMERLFKLNKPFMLVLPQIILNTIYFAEWGKKDKDIQIFVLPRRVDFNTSQEGVKKTIHTLVVCWKMNLGDRLVFG
jgi:hypothetical protein